MKVLNSIKTIAFLTVMFLSMSLVKAQTIEVPEFWNHQFSMAKDVIYGSSKEQAVDIYRQGRSLGEPSYFQPDEDKKPTLIFFHGGGWVQSNKESRITYLIPYLQRGWNVVNVEYRKGYATAPNAAIDAVMVLKWIADNAERYKFDLDNIVVSGESAGGHLSLLAGFLNTNAENNPFYVGNKVKVKAIVNWFGISDLTKFYNESAGLNYTLAWIGSPDRLQDISEKYSPIHYVNKNVPAVLSIHGTADTISPIGQSEILHNALNKASVKNQLLAVDGGKHSGFTEAQFQEIYQTIFSFLGEIIIK